MTYILLNETLQTLQFPSINTDNICNYNLDTEKLINDGYVDIEESLITLFNQGKAKIQDNKIIDISETDGYKVKVAKQENTIKRAQIQSQIYELEKSQARPMRELRKDPENVYANNKMDSIDAQIQDLRMQIATLN